MIRAVRYRALQRTRECNASRGHEDPLLAVSAADTTSLLCPAWRAWNLRRTRRASIERGGSWDPCRTLAFGRSRSRSRRALVVSRCMGDRVRCTGTRPFFRIASRSRKRRVLRRAWTCCGRRLVIFGPSRLFSAYARTLLTPHLRARVSACVDVINASSSLVAPGRVVRTSSSFQPVKRSRAVAAAAESVSKRLAERNDGRVSTRTRRRRSG